METSEQIKSIVKDKYAEIVLKADGKGCCGPTSCCGSIDPADILMNDDYTKLEGYNPDADLNLGCGLPTQYAHIKEGDTVVDLGSGAGNDAFVARSIVGEKGRVVGLDMTGPMIRKARENAAKLGYSNVQFVLGDIENMPIETNFADVVVSNCVMNLVPDKQKAFEETLRILKPGGHFSISDIVLRGEINDKLRNDMAMYAGCVAGALQINDYLNIVKQAGFQNIVVQKEKKIQVADEVLLNYFTKEELLDQKEKNNGIFSITVYAEKPTN